MMETKPEKVITMPRPTRPDRQELEQLADNTARAMAKLFAAAPEVEAYVRRNYRPA